MVEVQNKQLTFKSSKGTEISPLKIIKNPNGIEIKKETEKYEMSEL